MTLTDNTHNGLLGRLLWKPESRRIKVAFNARSAEVIHHQDPRWPVVGCPDIATFKANLEYISSFEEVHMMTPNRELAEAAAMLLPYGVGHIAPLEQEPWELVEANRYRDVEQAFFNASPWKPEDILSWEEALKKVEELPDVISYDYPFTHQLNDMTAGCRMGEIMVLTAGTGVGKSTLAREFTQHLVETEGLRVGYIALEEDVRECVGRLASLQVKRPLYLEPHLDVEEIRAKSPAFSEHLYLCNYPGGIESAALLGKIRYMALGLGCSFVFLDHITLCVGSGSSDDLKAMDQLTAGLRAVAQETGVGIFLVSQLRKGDSRSASAEEGGEISLSDLKGSGSLPQICNTIMALERNQQGEDSNRARVRVLKCRHTGKTGIAGDVVYDPETARMIDGTIASITQMAI